MVKFGADEVTSECAVEVDTRGAGSRRGGEGGQDVAELLLEEGHIRDHQTLQRTSELEQRQQIFDYLEEVQEVDIEVTEGNFARCVVWSNTLQLIRAILCW